MPKFRLRRRSVATFGFAGVLALVGGALVATPPAGAAVTITNYGISPAVAPYVYTGVNGQSAANVTFTLKNSWAQNDTVQFIVSPSDSATGNCKAANTDWVVFSGTPTVSAAAGGANTGDTAPTFSSAFSSNNPGDNGCTGFNDILTVTITNAPKGTATDTWSVTISGIAYSVGSTTATGPVTLTSTPAGAASNATVVNKAAAGATGNNPVTYVPVNTNGASVSNIVVTETAAKAVSGSICVTPIPGVTTFVFAGTPSTTASPTGTGAGTVTATTISAGSILVTLTGSTTVATTYTISGVTVNNGPASGPAYASVTTGGASCAADAPNVVTAQLPVYDSSPALQTAIYGTDADATAIAEMTKAFPPTGCPANHTAIIATDQNFPDALAASYLAGYLKSGILLTPTAQLSTETQTALENFGITSVYVVGGPLAVSQNTINQINATPSYPCGGPGAGASTGKIQVASVLAGQDQYGTAQAIDGVPPATYVNSLNLSGAYGGQYNDTTGTQSSAPQASGALKTAIVATGASFQDAAGASVLAYHDQLPLVLTDPNTLSSEASTTLQGFGIQQVIVLGGPLAVSNADVSAIQALNISVIRIAGQDLTDTAQMLANFELQSTAGSAGLGWTSAWGHQILVARGDFYSDALAGCVLDGPGSTSPLLLTLSPSTVGQYLTTFLNTGGSAAGIDNLGAGGNIQSVQPLGGPLALFTSTLQTIVQDVAQG